LRANEVIESIDFVISIKNGGPSRHFYWRKIDFYEKRKSVAVPCRPSGKIPGIEL
jgi:hypothetical protein